jgi:acyl-CoA synthetase (NDP forming)
VGKVGLIGQSGGNTSYLIRAASQRGVRFSKAVSYGNACDINESHLLEYFAHDPETEIVAAYIEGIKDGERFHRVLSRLSAAKPVLILKGGYTRAGGEIAASHTGSLAGSAEVWDSLIQQSGAISVGNLEEMVDLLVTFALLPMPKGRKVGVFGGGGGASVLATDELTMAGFTVPRLPPELIKELMELFGNTAGMIFKNPIDLSMVGYSQSFYDVVKRLLSYSGGDSFDFGLIHAGFGQAAWFSSSAFEIEINQFRDFVTRIHRETDKPLALVLQFLITNWDWQKALDLQRGCSEAGMPVYHSMASAAKAIDRFLRYHEAKQRAGKAV